MRLAITSIIAVLASAAAFPASAQEPPAALPPGMSDMMVRDLGRDRADALVHPDPDADRTAAASWLLGWVRANRDAPAGTYVPPPGLRGR